MARTIKEIYNAIVTEKQLQTELNALQPAIDNNQTLLSDLTTPSRVAVWRLMYWIFSVALWAHETLWDYFKIEVETIKAQSKAGTADWLQSEALKFQYGDTLLLIDNIYQYTEIDTDKQIIKRCAVVETSNQVIVKVAKEDNGEPVKLDDTPGAEFDTFSAYMLNYKRFAGVNMSIISYNADTLKVSYKVYYDPTYTLATILNNVDSAINNFLSNLPFNGVFRVASFEDAIQDASGIIDFEQNSIEAKYENGIYENVSRVYAPVSGYLKIDGNFPVLTNFEFIANV